MGIDSLVGGSGNDRYDVDLVQIGNFVQLEDTVVEALNTGTDLVMLQGTFSSADLTTLTLAANLENINAHFATDTQLNITGNTLKNEITGNNLANLIDGGVGNDLVYGEEGNDSLIGGLGDDNLNGNEGNDSLAGGDGNDILDGDTGVDSLIGGKGNDTYLLDDVNDIAEDTIEEDSIVGGGTDTVKTIYSGYTLGDYLENLTLIGTDAINGTGNALKNIIIGNAANNILNGGDGNDSLLGGDGDDTLNGDTGSDSLTGGNGNDTIAGGLGKDTLVGGLGNDTYNMDAVITGTNSATYKLTVEDTIIEALNGGVDTLILQGNIPRGLYYTLGANLESLDASQVLGIDSFSTIGIGLIGNTLNNHITGNTESNVMQGGTGNDTLHGGLGEDTLQGGLGADLLEGGAGFDTFVFNTTLGASNIDSITDFTSGGDRIQLSVLTFTALEPFKGNADFAGAFYITGGASAQDANDFIVYNTVTGALYYDKDASGIGAAVQFATLQSAPALHENDFLVAHN